MFPTSPTEKLNAFVAPNGSWWLPPSELSSLSVCAHTCTRTHTHTPHAHHHPLFNPCLFFCIHMCEVMYWKLYLKHLYILYANRIIYLSAKKKCKGYYILLFVIHFVIHIVLAYILSYILSWMSFWKEKLSGECLHQQFIYIFFF